MRHFPDTFQLAPAVADQVRALVESRPEFRHLLRMRLGCLFSERCLLDRGTVLRAQLVYPAQISSKQCDRMFFEWSLAQLLRPIFAGELPDFVLYVDRAQWDSLAPLEREQLVYHELCHLAPKLTDYGAPRFGDDGRPALRLQAHDAELFYRELATYGRIVPSFDATATALAQGARVHAPALVKRRA